MIALVVLNDPPYGTERSHHGLRLAQAMARADDTRVQVFLLGDAVACAKAGQRTPDGWYDTSRMLGGLMAAGAEVRASSACLDARGIAEAELVIGIERSDMAALAEWTTGADRILVF
ncbi:MAG: DsrE family protein [Rhodobacteraceae bacterium]|nr:DsrE family protein [Paracoccaceae bacterium]